MIISKSLLLAFLAAASTEALVPLAPRSRVAPLVRLGYSRNDYFYDAPPRDDYLPVEEPLPPRYPEPVPYFDDDDDDVYREPFAARDYDDDYYYPPRRNEYYDEGPRTNSHFYEPSRRSSSSWDTTYVDDRTQSIRRPTLTEDPENFYENRSYDAAPGDRWAESIHRRKTEPLAGMDDYVSYPNFGLGTRRQTHRGVPMASDDIPGRDQSYVDSKEQFLQNRREDLWSRFFQRGRNDGGAFMSQDLRDTVRDQQQVLQPLLQEVLACVESDPVCQQVLGPDIRLDQPLSQSQTSSSQNGRRTEPSQIEMRLRAQGRRGVGTLDVYATDIGITELILTTPGPRGEPRRIHVNLLGISTKPGIDIVDRTSPRDRGEGYANPFLPTSMVPNVMDAEFEVLPQNLTVY